MALLGVCRAVYRPHATTETTRPTICYRATIYRTSIYCCTPTCANSSLAWAYGKRSPDWGRSLGVQGAYAAWAEPGPTIVWIQSTRPVRFRDQCLVRRAAVTTKITEAAQTNGRSVQRTDPQHQVYRSPRQPAEVAIARRWSRKVSMKGKWVRGTWIRVQTPRFWWEANLIGKGRGRTGRKLGGFIPLHPLLHSCTMRNPAVSEHGHSRCCL